MGAGKSFALGTIMMGLMASSALGATVSGKIADAAGKPVAGIILSARELAGQDLRSAVSGAKGQYEIVGLTAGRYEFTLNPGSSGFKKGGPVLEPVGDKGLTLDWMVSPSAEAVASAKTGAADSLLDADPFGLTMAEFLVMSASVAAGMGGVAVGAYAGAGGFGGVVSPSK